MELQGKKEKEKYDTMIWIIIMSVVIAFSITFLLITKVFFWIIGIVGGLLAIIGHLSKLYDISQKSEDLT